MPSALSAISPAFLLSFALPEHSPADGSSPGLSRQLISSPVSLLPTSPLSSRFLNCETAFTFSVLSSSSSDLPSSFPFSFVLSPPSSLLISAETSEAPPSVPGFSIVISLFSGSSVLSNLTSSSLLPLSLSSPSPPCLSSSSFFPSLGRSVPGEDDAAAAFIPSSLCACTAAAPAVVGLSDLPTKAFPRA